ncbi:MAG: hypothetical protein HY428_01670 [Candidatus Levybacteria bacterium]|nr:hypothetical protein [Candidatus Levybacteria bacterium]
MKKHFYSHIVRMDTLHVELGSMDLSEEEREHLLSLADSNVHHAVMGTILSELSHEDKKIFLRLSAIDDHNAIWRHLNKKIHDIQGKIKKAASEILTDLHQDIEEAKGEK